METNKIIGKATERAILSLIEKAHPKILYQKPIRCKIYLPKFCIESFIEYLNGQIKGTSFSKTGKNFYRGVEIVEGYELAAVLVHEDYPLFNDPDLIVRQLIGH